MASAEDITAELKSRIEKDIAHFQGAMPERYAIAWRAYLAGLLEWNVLGIPTYDKLLDLLPEVDDDPSIEILQGRD